MDIPAFKKLKLPSRDMQQFQENTAQALNNIKISLAPTSANANSNTSGVPAITGRVLKMSYTERLDKLALSTAVMLSSQIPTITTGTEVFNIDYPAAKIGNYIVIEVHLWGAESVNTSTWVSVALFINNGTNAIAAAVQPNSTTAATLNGGLVVLRKTIKVQTNSVNIKIRAGMDGATTNILINQNTNGSGIQDFGGGMFSTSIMITEIEQ